MGQSGAVDSTTGSFAVQVRSSGADPVEPSSVGGQLSDGQAASTAAADGESTANDSMDTSPREDPMDTPTKGVRNTSHKGTAIIKVRPRDLHEDGHREDTGDDQHD